MSHAAANPAVLSRLYLNAVLPCLEDLTEQDPVAQQILGNTDASILMRIASGPAATLRFRSARVTWQQGKVHAPSVVLLFLSDSHLNAFFSGKTWALPIPLWGGWRAGLLARFAKLAQRLEAVLDGHASVLESTAGRRLHARLSLITAGLGLHPLAQADEAARSLLLHLPPGLASFRIEGESRATVWFDHDRRDNVAGWCEPPRLPEVCIVFDGVETAFAALREEIDTLAAVGRGQIRVEGLVPLADGLNIVMQRLRVYLKT
jgi:hypothetical protein